MFACETINSGPFGAWFRTGTSRSAQPELYVPMTATSSVLPACALAFAVHVAGSHLPAAAVESSYFLSLTLKFPALPLTESK